MDFPPEHDRYGSRSTQRAVGFGGSVGRRGSRTPASGGFGLRGNWTVIGRYTRTGAFLSRHVSTHQRTASLKERGRSRADFWVRGARVRARGQLLVGVAGGDAPSRAVLVCGAAVASAGRAWHLFALKFGHGAFRPRPGRAQSPRRLRHSCKQCGSHADYELAPGSRRDRHAAGRARHRISPSRRP